MNTIIDKIQRETGISTEQATQAFNIVSTILKEKLPYSLSVQLDDLLAGKEIDYAPLIKEKMDNFSNSANEKIHEATKETTEKISELTEDAKNLINKLFK